MLCPIRLDSLTALKNGQDATRTSPMILWLQHGPSCNHQPTE